MKKVIKIVLIVAAVMLVIAGCVALIASFSARKKDKLNTSTMLASRATFFSVYSTDSDMPLSVMDSSVMLDDNLNFDFVDGDIPSSATFHFTDSFKAACKEAEIELTTAENKYGLIEFGKLYVTPRGENIISFYFEEMLLVEDFLPFIEEQSGNGIFQIDLNYKVKSSTTTVTFLIGVTFETHMDDEAQLGS